MNNELYIVKALIRLKATEDGGRRTSIVSGYRPNHVFEYRDNGKMLEAYMGDLKFDQEFLHPVRKHWLSCDSLDMHLLRSILPWEENGGFMKDRILLAVVR